MSEIVLKGHKVAKGKAEGEALVTSQPFCFVFQVDTDTGVVIEPGNEWEGISLKDKILVFPKGKGSTGSSSVIYEMRRCGTQPKGIINLVADPVVVAGAILSDIPMVDKLDGNPVELIKSGDHVVLDADSGLVKVSRRD